MKVRIICMFTLLASAFPFYAQDHAERKSWTLEDCINYALEKNIQLQQDKISLQESEIDIKDARASLFPTLSFSTGHNIVNRPYQEQSATVSGTEIISSNQNTTYNGSYNLSVQWTLWNGGRRLNTLKQQKTNRDIAQLSVSETENMLQEQIAQLFIQILYLIKEEKNCSKKEAFRKPTLPNWKRKSATINTKSFPPKVPYGITNYN